MIGLLITLVYLEKVPLNTKVMYPLMSYCLIFFTITIMVVISMNGEVLFWLTLLLTFLSGLVGSVLSGGLFGMAAYFPPQNTGSMCSGQGLAGLVVSLSSIITISAGETANICTDDSIQEQICEFSVSYSALAYFAISTIVLVTCGYSFVQFLKLPYTR